ncbi:hypothetical protein [Paenibacillus sacheonensis]|uniref:Uncharacterized protein n=1 Tax=Paenibacillus sacheonensis TaxID=742054 RepID=A0A7X4YKP5_9BACL|nr:hypothetical protein [Paenibacillus sacheonensis]MBM7563290.1 putative membrane protein [Paenibacillus sacheonensis]NBC68152.1 hypothetical protein [Paenibacillus sacheonensis]
MNVFYLASLAVVTGLSGRSIYSAYRRRPAISCMAGMMIAMTIGMMQSLAAGTIAGILLPSDLAVPTAGAVLLGIVCGYLAGKPISTMAALDGMLAGIMGGMMGAMLGVMIGRHAVMTVLFVDVIFVFIHIVLHQLINEETAAPSAAEKTETGQAGTVLLHPYVFGLGIFILAAVFLYQG